MTAANPTAMEQATIDRLGVFDEEKFTEIVSNDETVKCCKKECDAEAWWHIIMRCCGHPFPMCAPHKNWHRANAKTKSL